MVVKPSEPLPSPWAISMLADASVFALAVYSKNNSEYMMPAPRMAMSKCTPALEK